MEGYKTGTICFQAGWMPENGELRVLPIYQSTTFKYKSSEQMARLFDLEEDGYYYTRLQNPTNEYVASKIAKLESGVAAMLTFSGQAAVFHAIMTLCSAGDHIVSSSTLYGGIFNLFSKTLPKLGIKVSFVDPNATTEEISRSINKNTKLIFAETISNPVLNVLDIDFYSHYGKKAYIAKTTMQSMRDLGAVPSPQNSFLLMETLHLRMARHYENALKVTRFLQSCQKIAWINYPMLPENKNYERDIEQALNTIR